MPHTTPQGRSLLNRITFGVLGRSQPPARTGLRAFSGARIDRLSADWLATGQSINQELRGDLDRLRARGRDLAKNQSHARKFVGMARNNIVGPDGVRLQARVADRPGVPDTAANAAIEQSWKSWQYVADVAGRQHFRDLCNTLVGGLPSDGEFLVREVMGTDAGNRFNYALQVIDVDRIDTSFNGRSGANTVIMGVEVNAYRRPVALHIFTAHPNDGVTTSRQRERVPIEQIIHAFQAEHAEQLRGIPWMAPGMLSLHHLSGFMHSAVLAAEHGANHYGFFKTPDGGPPPVGEVDQSTDQTITTSQPGTFDTLPVGVEFQAFDSKYPNEVFGPFAKTTLQSVATGWRVAYVSLANDLEGVNFSSIRQGVLEERDRWMADQQWFIASFLERVYLNWLRMALMSGQIVMPNGAALPAAKFAKFAAHEWQPRTWAWVDPKADAEAQILMVTAGAMTPQQLAASVGNDFADAIDQIAQAQQMAATAGVRLPAYDGKPGANSSNPPGAVGAQ